MLRNLRVVLISASALALGACSSSSSPAADSGPPAVVCSGSPTTCNIPAGASEAEIDSAVAGATAGTTFIFAETDAPFTFTNTLTIPGVANLTFTGAGIGKTVLDFSNQTSGSGGISAVLGNTNLRFNNLTVQNTSGDGIKVAFATGVVFEKVQVQWVNPQDGGALPVLSHGGYGIYPVQSQNVVIDNCQISGARDTGAYIGQSNYIVVSNNLVSQNVAGIEIESSLNADVYGNESTANSGGILVFALPNLQPPPGTPPGTTDACANVHVFNNNIHDNNTINFADPSGTVWDVPSGTALVVLAAQNVEIDHNTITNNDSASIGVVTYFLINESFDPRPDAGNPTGLYPFANNVYIHDNTFSNNGTSPITDNLFAPDGGSPQNTLGLLLYFLQGGGAYTTVPDLAWDGIAPPPFFEYNPPTGKNDMGAPANPVNIWFANNKDINTADGGAGFVNLNLEVVGANPSQPNPNAVNFNRTGFDITDGGPAGFPLPPVDAGISP
jgi:parallel beta-helix repeat protein